MGFVFKNNTICDVIETNGPTLFLTSGLGKTFPIFWRKPIENIGYTYCQKVCEILALNKPKSKIFFQFDVFLFSLSQHAQRQKMQFSDKFFPLSHVVQ